MLASPALPDNAGDCFPESRAGPHRGFTNPTPR